MEALRVKRFNDAATLPTRGSSGAVGYDLACTQDFVLDTQSHTLVSTGLGFQLPSGVYGRVAPRSGLTVKHGIHIGAGVIDPDYMGEVKVAMFNLGLQPVEFKKGDRIAQLILERCEVPEVLEVDILVSTYRGESGFGSTGN
ncbi:dUTP diphosphatase [bacterium]|nr:dUTP diphosphatase [bacterium]